jgi:hypothetical protein
MGTKNRPIVRLEKKMRSLADIRTGVGYTRRRVVGEPFDEDMKVVRLHGSDDPYRDAKEMLSNVSNIRSNAVYAVEFVMTASPSYFRGLGQGWGEYDQEKLMAYLHCAVEWAKEYFGDNLVSITLHLDQATPHVHLLVIPLLGGRLNCRELYSLRERLKQLQLSYAKAMVPLGLERSTPEVGAQHTPRGKWIAETEAEQRRRAKELAERERAVAEKEERAASIEKELNRRRAKIVEAGDAVREYAMESEEVRAGLEQHKRKYHTGIQALDLDAKRLAELISDLEEMKIEIPEEEIMEGSEISEKFGIPLQ